MTSEVLILNKRAIVIGADSAVTSSGRGEHPRYSKSATKIFELSKAGSVAAAIYGNSNIDLTPWELVIKLFRQNLGDATFETVKEYGIALLEFISCNPFLAPDALRQDWVESQFDMALVEILKFVESTFPVVFDVESDQAERAAGWQAAADQLDGLLNVRPLWESFPVAQLDALIADLDQWAARAQAQIDAAPKLSAVGARKLAELAHRLRYVNPEILLSYTGLVVAGYGESQIFPAYHQWQVVGHVGDALGYKLVNERVMSLTTGPVIVPLARQSMIQMFTDGFGPSSAEVIDRKSRESMSEVISRLRGEGVDISDDVAQRVVNDCHDEFSIGWKKQNWNDNYNPLINVLETLSVQEMAHLAESLLGLESLKERVTSPSESVGGPIDVAAISKSEGLVWIKRKHYFDADINLRYAARLNRSFG